MAPFIGEHGLRALSAGIVRMKEGKKGMSRPKFWMF
jgi:hypothetical protein